MKAITLIAGIVCGLILGFGLGVLIATGLAYWNVQAHPKDPSAAAVSIVVVATAPVSALLGAVLGGATIAASPRLFNFTILPITLLFIIFFGTYNILASIDSPRTFSLAIDGSPEAEFIGVISVDGKVTPLKGRLPAEFQVKGQDVDLTFVLAHPDATKTISVHVLTNENNLHTGYETQTGIRLRLKSHGISEAFGSTSARWSRMSEQEVERFIKHQELPELLFDL